MPPAGSCGPGSPQERWLRADLAAHANTCVLAYWHEPRFSSGWHGNDPRFDAFWDALYRAGAEIVLNGHDHDYERFAPQDPDGRLDPAKGIRQFVVGTGGGACASSAPSSPTARSAAIRASGFCGSTSSQRATAGASSPRRVAPSPTAALAAVAEPFTIRAGHVE